MGSFGNTIMSTEARYYPGFNCNNNPNEECCRAVNEGCQCKDCFLCGSLMNYEIDLLFNYLMSAISQDRIRFNVYTSLPNVPKKEDLDELGQIAGKLKKVFETVRNLSEVK